MSDYYTVVKGDTLSKIATAKGTTVDELVKLNQIENPNRLAVGQQLALNKSVVLGVQPLFLDTNRDPISGLDYVLEMAGQLVKGTTLENGLGKKIFTATVEDEVRILVKRLDGTLKEVGNVISGYGNKLVTLISPAVKVEGKTEKHPELKPGERPNPTESVKPAYDPKATQSPTTDKKDLGLNTKNKTTPDGKPLVVVTGDIPDLSFLDAYNGEVMTETDYEWAAKELDVDIAAIKAFALVESGGGGFFIMEKRKVPKILYERHYFARLTENKYSSKYPDISLPNGYYVGGVKYVEADADYKKNHGVPDDVYYYRPLNKNDSKEVKEKSTDLKNLIEENKVSAKNNKYFYGSTNYKRLAKAYQLDKDAALQSCSWGAFQIMGSNWKEMGYQSISDFVKLTSRSEKEQIKAFVIFIKKVKPGIVKALKDGDWDTAARLYNGKNYKQNKYDKLLADEYKRIKDEK